MSVCNCELQCIVFERRCFCVADLSILHGSVHGGPVCVCLALASVAESRTPGLLSVILPPAEVLVMPGDRPEWIEKEWKIGAGR